MTSINSVGTAAPPPPMDAARKQKMDKVFQAVADKLGISLDDLKADLQKGQSLTDVAASKGVSKDDLVSTIKTALGTDATDEQATRIADHKGGHHHYHRVEGAGDQPPPPPPVQPGASTNDALGANLDQTL